MNTQCAGEQLEFHPLGRRSVIGRFDGGRISSDSGGVLLREVDKHTGVTARVSKCFTDYRYPATVEHDVYELVSQCPFAIALGYEDRGDHGELHGDALLSLLVGKRDVTGDRRIRERHRGYALASASTFSRMELGHPEEEAHDRYKRIVARPEAFDELVVKLFIESHCLAPTKIWLDLFADRTSAHWVRANQLRLFFSSFAYVLMQTVRRLGAQGTQFARAQCATLRLKLLKFGARHKITTRRVWLSFSESYPYARTFTQVLSNLQQHPLWNPSG